MVVLRGGGEVEGAGGKASADEDGEDGCEGHGGGGGLPREEVREGVRDGCERVVGE